MQNAAIFRMETFPLIILVGLIQLKNTDGSTVATVFTSYSLNPLENK